jgi:hypothetical protein
MGFQRDQALLALRTFNNNFEFALNNLLRQQAAKDLHQQRSSQMSQDKEMCEEVQLLYTDEFDLDQNEPVFIQQLCSLIEHSLVPVVSSGLVRASTTMKRHFP